MKCFNHPDIDAVGLCKVCLKALCSQCASEDQVGIVCKDGCGPSSGMAFNTGVGDMPAVQKKGGKQTAFRVFGVILFLLVAVGAFWAIHEHNLQKSEAEVVGLGKSLARKGAEEMGYILNRAITDGTLTVDDVFDENYTLIPGSNPPKYHTRYDSFLDEQIRDFQDDFLENSKVVFAVAVDRNGYLPTHNSRYSKPLSGDPNKDRAGNRTKRVFNDPVGLSAARNQQDYLVQTYLRDTGLQMFDVSAPIYVNGRHWGAFRVGLEFR